MLGIPRAPGHRAYLSVGREVGALCVERLAVFLSPIHSRHSVALFKFGFPPSQDSSLGPVTGLSWGKRKFWRTCDRVGDSRHVGFL